MTTNKRRFSGFSSTNYRTISQIKTSLNPNVIKHGNIELDSHTDSIVEGSNCCIMHFINSECNVSPHRDDYAPIKNFPIVQATTAITSSCTGKTRILTLNEAM